MFWSDRKSSWETKCRCVENRIYAADITHIIPWWYKHLTNATIQIFFTEDFSLCEQMFQYLAICPQSSWVWNLDGCIYTNPCGFYWILQTIGIQSKHVRQMWPSFHSVVVSQCNILHPLLIKTMRNLGGVLNMCEMVAS